MERSRDGANKIHNNVIGEDIRTGKVEELRRVTEETRNFYILVAGKL